MNRQIETIVNFFYLHLRSNRLSDTKVMNRILGNMQIGVLAHLMLSESLACFWVIYALNAKLMTLCVKSNGCYVKIRLLMIEY